MTTCLTPGARSTLDRREWLRRAAALGGLAGLGAPLATRAQGLAGSLAPLRAEADRMFDITVCLRPFRATGPRLDTERLGDTFVVHNYGHGGSGWSLSWGSGTLAVQKAMSSGARRIGVIGCGALGLTSAILAQRAGAEVTIYARDFLPQTRSARATGTWSPDSRIALADKVDDGFALLWEQMARTSFHAFRQYLGLPGSPVEWVDRYILHEAEAAPAAPAAAAPGAVPDLNFIDYRERFADLQPPSQLLAPGATPFPTPIVKRTSSMMFNIADYAHTLMSDFLLAGGKFERREFHTPAELTRLPQKTIINCPGYGARALWKDESIVPVRGQIAWLVPQPELDYGVYYHQVSMLPRRDGIVLQDLRGGDMRGYGNDNETPEPDEAHYALSVMAELYGRFGKTAGG